MVLRGDLRNEPSTGNQPCMSRIPPPEDGCELLMRMLMSIHHSVKRSDLPFPSFEA